MSNERPPRYAPIAVTAEQLKQANSRFVDLVQREVDAAIQRQLKWLMSPMVYVRPEPLKLREDGDIEIRRRFQRVVTMSPAYYAVLDPAPPRIDPLDVEYDGSPLRKLLESDEAARRERNRFARRFTPVQQAAVSAHWSAQLRAKATAAAEQERRRVLVDIED